MRHGKPYRRWGGPQRRINILRNLLTGLIRFERIETSMAKAHECQKYAERIIHVAKRGDRDPDAMKVAEFWLTSDKAQVHKLFKVLGPRFAQSRGPFTKLHKTGEPGYLGRMSAFLEYKWNPYPPLQPVERKNPRWLVNVLLQGAHQDFHDSGLAQKLSSNITNDRRIPGVSGMVGDEGSSVDDRSSADDSPETDKNRDGTPV